MIREVSVEKALHCWEPWVKAVWDAREYIKVKGDDYEKLWYNSSLILMNLRFPAKPLFRLYLLSCVFSDYDYKIPSSFDRIQYPPQLLGKLVYFNQSARILNATDMVIEFMGNHKFRYRPDIELLRRRPLPPAIWTNKDVHFALNWMGNNPFSFDMSVFEMLGQNYGPYFMVLSPQHPLFQIVTKIKRGISTDMAVACAEMKDQGHTYREIANKFGWALQLNEYGKPVRSSTARRYVQRGRRLKKHD
jgi:hypothetical protein